MAIGIGSHCDVTMFNVIVQELSPGALTFARVTLPVSAEASPTVDVWVPIDERILAKEIAPSSWPPLAGDIWEASGVSAWVVDDGTGTLYFVTADNVRSQTTPITTDAALITFGNSLTLVFRPTS